MNLESGNLLEAENLFRKAINDSPDFGAPYKFLGNIKPQIGT